LLLACTDVTRKLRSCVHTHTKATYDVHAVFSVHVCHTNILLCDDCTFFPLFSNFSEVYTTSIHSLAALQHYNSWNFTGILHILAQCCLEDGYIKEHLLYLIWIHGNYHLDGHQGYTGFTVFVIACLCHDCD